MPEVTAEDLDLINDTPAGVVPNVMTADEAVNLSDVVVEVADAPLGFWERRKSDVEISGASAARPVASAMVFYGNRLLKDVPSPYGDIRRAPTFLERGLESFKPLLPTLHPETAETVGKFLVQTGLGFQDQLDKYVEKKNEGREDEGRYDIPRMVTQGSLSILASLGTALAFRSAVVPGVAIGGGAFFETYDKSIRKGKNYDEAVGLASIMGLAQGGTEFFGLHTFLNITGGAFKRFVLSGVTESIQEGTQTGSQELIERVSGISDTQKRGIESVQEAVADTLVAAALGFALGAPASVGPALANRRNAKQMLKNQGLTEEQATKVVDKALERGVSGAVEIMAQEKQLMDKGVYRDAEGNPVVDTPQGPKILTQEEVVAKFTEVPEAISNPLAKAARDVIDAALPLKETVGVTQAEKELMSRPAAQESQQEQIVDEPTLKALEQKFVKIEQSFKRPEKITRERVKAVQKALQSFIRSKKLQLKDRAKLETEIINAQTLQQLERRLAPIRERIAELKEVQAQQKAISEFERLAQERRISKVESSYQQAIRDLVNDLTTKKISVKTALSLENLAEYLAREPEAVIPQYRLNELRKLELKSLRDMPPKDIQLINDAISHLYKLGEQKATLLYKGEVVDADGVKTDVLKRLEAVPVKSELDGPRIDPLKFAGGRNIFGVLKDALTIDRRHVDIVAQELDGQDDGPLKALVWRGLSDAKTHSLRLEQAVEDYFVETFRGVDLSKWSEYIAMKKEGLDRQDFTFISDKGDVTIPITKAQQVYFFLAMQNENSARHIMKGGISFDRDVLRGKSYGVSEDTATKIMETVVNDPQMMKAANAISEYLNGFQKDLLNNASFRLLGYSVAVEENYVHIRVNPNLRSRMAELTQKHKISHALLEGLGFLKERVKSTVPIYLDDIFASVQESSHYAIRYAVYAEPLRAAKKVLNDQQIRAQLEASGRGKYLRAMEEHLEQVEGALVESNDVEKSFRLLNTSVQGAILKLNPRIALLQYTAYITASTEIDTQYWANSFSPVVSSKDVAEIKQWSPKIYDRSRGHTLREVGDLVDITSVRKMFTGKSAYDDWMLAGIRKADRAVLASIWRAVKREIEVTQPELTGDAFMRAVAARAEDVVRKTQAPFDVNDRSIFLGRKDWASRTLSLFGSEIDALSNVIERAHVNWRQSNKSWGELGRFVKNLSTIYLVNSLVVAFLRLPFNMLKEAPDKGREDEEAKDAEIIVKRLLIDVLSGPIGLVFGLREAGAAAVAGLLGAPTNWDINQPVFATGSDAFQAVARVLAAINEAVMGDEFSEAPRKKKKDWVDKLVSGIVDLGVSIATFKGIPAGNVKRFLDPFFSEPKDFE